MPASVTSTTVCAVRGSVPAAPGSGPARPLRSTTPPARRGRPRGRPPAGATRRVSSAAITSAAARATRSPSDASETRPSGVPASTSRAAAFGHPSGVGPGHRSSANLPDACRLVIGSPYDRSHVGRPPRSNPAAGLGRAPVEPTADPPIRTRADGVGLLTRPSVANRRPQLRPNPTRRIGRRGRRGPAGRQAGRPTTPAVLPAAAHRPRPRLDRHRRPHGHRRGRPVLVRLGVRTDGGTPLFDEKYYAIQAQRDAAQRRRRGQPGLRRGRAPAVRQATDRHRRVDVRLHPVRLAVRVGGRRHRLRAS